MTTQLTAMREQQKPGTAHTDEQAMRDEEVLRASRELAACFQRRRTEREARAALQIIKAYVREREGSLDPKSRPPLAGLRPARSRRRARRRNAQSHARAAAR